ncbi:MAG: hypothetical protein ACRDPK_04690 [Carbonactinosporaceae bacterium]
MTGGTQVEIGVVVRAGHEDVRRYPVERDLRLVLLVPGEPGRWAADRDELVTGAGVGRRNQI